MIVTSYSRNKNLVTQTKKNIAGNIPEPTRSRKVTILNDPMHILQNYTKYLETKTQKIL